MVRITPSGVIVQIRLFLESAMYAAPVESKAMPIGFESPADNAGPPSPLNPAFGPATVAIKPSGVTLRTRWLAESAMYTVPDAFITTKGGFASCASTATGVAGRMQP